MTPATNNAPNSTDTEILRSHMRTGRPLGRPEFVELLEARLGRELAPGKRGLPGRTRRAVSRYDEDSHGKQVPHGVYFYGLTTPGLRSVKKAVVTR